MKSLVPSLTAALFLLIVNNTASLGAVSNDDQNVDMMIREGVRVAQDSEGLNIETPIYVEFPEIVFTFDREISDYYFLKINYIVEASNELDVGLINEMQADILDSIYIYLRNMNSNEISQSNAVYRIKEILFSRINEVIEPVEIQDVLIQRFLLQ